ncbi:MAG: heme exporter protein CcmD [Alphaproteobacteria bacterium]|nr:heme exporter protein CcmD [Alphaproteobacteria bacterium]
MEMGGHAAYVWPALILTALVLTLLAVHSLRQLGAREAELATLERERPRRRRGQGGSGDDA